MPRVQTIPTYRLRQDKLEEYLRKLFPTHDNFKVKMCEDGREMWSFEAPDALTSAQIREINDNVRTPTGGDELL